jgi:hypothetical protein
MASPSTKPGACFASPRHSESMEAGQHGCVDSKRIALRSFEAEIMLLKHPISAENAVALWKTKRGQFKNMIYTTSLHGCV